MSRPTTTLHRFAWQAGSLAEAAQMAQTALDTRPDDVMLMYNAGVMQWYASSRKAAADGTRPESGQAADLTAAAAWRNLQGIRKGEIFPIILLSAILGFQVVGLTDSPIDALRVAFLYYMIVMLSLIQGKGEKHA